MSDFTGAMWRKASRSNGSGGECVEVTFTDNTFGVRDSKHTVTLLATTERSGWKQFRATLQ